MDARSEGLPVNDDPETADPHDADPHDEKAREDDSRENDDTRDDGARKERAPAEPVDEGPVDEGDVLFAEQGGSWWVVAIGPVMVGAVLAMEITGPGQVHWTVMSMFALILVAFALVQVYAARRHVSVCLTETTLRQGTRTLPLSDIKKIYPPNESHEAQKWESAKALGELHGVPRRRKGIGVVLTDGALAQAWARDVEGLRRELTEAVRAVQLGLPPRGTKD
ncbi:DUF3093 domain-containing protein [Gordonia pseudamarae]|uniref:DUF3093 domain-containing protein n=1 Tax=Gordonia pseudamarae TaxID=2831662 RepID=UPI00389916F1